MATSRSRRSKQNIAAELKTLAKEFKQLQKTFGQIRKRSNSLLKKAHTSEDAREALSIRKKIG